VMRNRRSLFAGWLTVAQVIGVTPDGVNHAGVYDAGRPGGSSYQDDYQWRLHSGAASTRAIDGTLWADCEWFKLVVTYAWSSWWGGGPIIESGTTPGLSYAALKVTYRVAPVVTVTAPSGTVTFPTELLEWTVDDTPSAFRAVLVRSDQTDGGGLLPSNASYDPATVAAPVYDSGKTYTSATEFQPPDQASMLDGVSYYWFVKAWSTGSYGVEGESVEWDRSSLITADLPQVAEPGLSASTSSDWGTVEVVVTDGTPGGGEETPDSYVLQQLVDGVWTEVDAWAHGGGTRSYHDATLAFEGTGSYRARGLWADGDGVIFTSALVEHDEEMGSLPDWWLRDPSDYTRNMALHVAQMKRSIARPQSVEYPVRARSRAIVTHTGSRGDTLQASLWALTEHELERLEALLDVDTTLTLMSPNGRSWRVQPGPSVNIDILRAQPVGGLPGDNSRKVHKVEVTFTEVDENSP
jgi:hypothetical protein